MIIDVGNGCLCCKAGDGCCRAAHSRDIHGHLWACRGKLAGRVPTFSPSFPNVCTSVPPHHSPLPYSTADTRVVPLLARRIINDNPEERAVSRWLFSSRCNPKTGKQAKRFFWHIVHTIYVPYPVLCRGWLRIRSRVLACGCV